MREQRRKNTGEGQLGQLSILRSYKHHKVHWAFTSTSLMMWQLIAWCPPGATITHRGRPPKATLNSNDTDRVTANMWGSQ
jgi:hypothetical protein